MSYGDLNGINTNNTMEIFGHAWQREPYVNQSKSIGNNPQSEIEGARHGHGPSNHFDAVLLNGAGGRRLRVLGPTHLPGRPSEASDGLPGR